MILPSVCTTCTIEWALNHFLNLMTPILHRRAKTLKFCWGHVNFHEMIHIFFRWFPLNFQNLNEELSNILLFILTYLAGEGDTSTLKYKNKWHKATWSLPYFKRWWWMFTNACRFLHGSCWDEKLLLGPLHRNKWLGVSNNSLEKSIWHKTHLRWRHLSKLKNVSPLVRHFHGLFSRHISLFIYR